MLGLQSISICIALTIAMDLRLEGGAAPEEGISSSASLPRFRPPAAGRPRFAEDMLGRSGELDGVSEM